MIATSVPLNVPLNTCPNEPSPSACSLTIALGSMIYDSIIKKKKRERERKQERNKESKREKIGKKEKEEKCKRIRENKKETKKGRKEKKIITKTRQIN